MSSNANSALSYLRSNSTIDSAIVQFSEERHLNKGDALIKFAMEILHSQNELAIDDFSKLVELDQKFLTVSPETAKKITYVGLNLLMGDKLNPNFINASNVDAIFHALQYLNCCDPSMRKNPKTIVSCLALGIISKTSHEELLQEIQTYPPEELPKIIELAIPFLNDIPNSHARIELIKTIQSLPSKDREGIMNVAEKPLLKQSGGVGRALVIKEIARIYKEKGAKAAKQVIQLAKPILDLILNGHAKLIRATGELLEKHGFDGANSHLNNVRSNLHSSEHNGVAIAERIALINTSEGEHNSNSEKHSPTHSVKEVTRQVERDVAAIVELLPAKDRSVALIEELTSTLANLTTEERALFVRTIETTSNDNRLETIRGTINYGKGRPEKRRSVHEDTQSLLGSSNNEELIKKTALLYKRLGDGKSISEVLKLLEYAPAKDRVGLLEALFELSEITEGVDLKIILASMHLLDPRDQVNALHLIKTAINAQQIQIGEEELLNFLFSYAEGHEKIKTRSHAYLSRVLDSKNEVFVTWLADRITRFPDVYFIEKDGPLFEKASKIATPK